MLTVAVPNSFDAGFATKYESDVQCVAVGIPAAFKPQPEVRDWCYSHSIHKRSNVTHFRTALLRSKCIITFMKSLRSCTKKAVRLKPFSI